MAQLTNTEVGYVRSLIKALRVVANENLRGENERLKQIVDDITPKNNQYIQERNGWFNQISTARALLADIRSWLWRMDSPEAFADGDGGAQAMAERIDKYLGHFGNEVSDGE